jgi:hypothetical protein
MSYITFELMAIHEKTLRYSLSLEEYLEFRGLIMFGGEKVINGHYLGSDKEHLSHYKLSSFTSACYSVPLKGVLDHLDEREEYELNKT